MLDPSVLIRDDRIQELAEYARNTGQKTLVDEMERLNLRDRAVLFRLLPKDVAIDVFERLDGALQSELVHGLGDEQVGDLFAALETGDRVQLMDELPAKVAKRLLNELPTRERGVTNLVLGYPNGSIGRRMSAKYIVLGPEQTVRQALAHVRARAAEVPTIYSLPVAGPGRRLIGVLSLRDLLKAEETETIGQIMSPDPIHVDAYTDEEDAARLCADHQFNALPVTDLEERIIGIVNIDTALEILEEEETEDAARSGGTEPLRRPYLSTPVVSLVKSRIVWLLVLAVGATLTVQVLESFESTLEKVVALSLFVPLLIGTGGNTGNQTATTVTRALALGDVRTRDVLRVAAREASVGLLMGSVLGVLGFTVVSLIYSVPMGLVIGLTLAAICTLAATVGGVMPLIGKALKVDPAVFANPFISTFVDASGLIVYFLIAKGILGI
ncbi:magnesium transporter [Micrococcoides hystricis]|uniref:Magnesium transporter MgtE n=1 Tax=Micrococcoides hystricis TaxID=1572761 RepID=A0ABV6P9T2_9MICC